MLISIFGRRQKIYEQPHAIVYSLVCNRLLSAVETMFIYAATAEYAAPVWSHSRHTIKKWTLCWTTDALRIHNIRCHAPTPIAMLPVLAGIPPADIRRDHLVLKHAEKADQPGSLVPSIINNTLHPSVSTAVTIFPPALRSSKTAPHSHHHGCKIDGQRSVHAPCPLSITTSTDHQLNPLDATFLLTSHGSDWIVSALGRGTLDCS